MWAGCAGADAATEDPALVTALLTELAFPALAAFVDAGEAAADRCRWGVLSITVGLLPAGGRTEPLTPGRSASPLQVGQTIELGTVSHAHRHGRARRTSCDRLVGFGRALASRTR